MKLAVEIVVTMVLIIFGYIYVSYYMNEKKWELEGKNVIKIVTRNKILFVAAEVIGCTILLVLFQTIYTEYTLLHQLKRLILITMIFPMAAIDYKVQKIPNQLLIIALIGRVILYIFEFINNPSYAFSILKGDLLGAFIIGGFFLIILLVFKNSIGMGDIKLFAVMGLYQGLWGLVNSVFFALLAMFFISILLLVTRKKNRKDAISFGPGILVGAIVAIGLSGI